MSDIIALAFFNAMVVSVRYGIKNKIEDNLHFCKSFELHTRWKELFECVDNYTSKHDIGWDKCISMFTDGAKAMTGKLSGAVTRIKNVKKVASAIIAFFSDTHW